MKNLNCIFIVFGNHIQDDPSNLKSINTKVIPLTGDTIALNSGIYTVIGRCINYTQVQNYQPDSKERGGEVIYIFVK